MRRRSGSGLQELLTGGSQDVGWGTQGQAVLLRQHRHVRDDSFLRSGARIQQIAGDFRAYVQKRQPAVSDVSTI